MEQKQWCRVLFMSSEAMLLAYVQMKHIWNEAPYHVARAPGTATKSPFLSVFQKLHSLVLH